MKITKRQLVEIYQILSGQEIKHLTGRNFVYACSRNKYLIEPEFKALAETEKPFDEYNQYEEARKQLVIKYSQKDENNNPIMLQQNVTQIDPNQLKLFNEEHDKLKQDFKNAIDENKEQRKEFQKILDEEIDLNFHMIKFEDVPDNISYDIESKLYPIILPPIEDK